MYIYFSVYLALFPSGRFKFEMVVWNEHWQTSVSMRLATPQVAHQTGLNKETGVMPQ